MASEIKTKAEVLDTRPKSELKVVETRGNAYERGFHYGEKTRALVDRFLSQLYASYNELYGMSKDQLLIEARKYIPFIESYSPEVMNEIKGIAEGVGKNVEEIAMAVAYYDISEARSQARGGCTAFAATGQATVGRQTYIGQSWDDCLEFWWDGEINIVIKSECNSGMKVLAYTIPAIPAGAGLNSEGIALCWNSMHCEQREVGVPTYVIIREVLNQRTIGDALGAIVRAKRAESFNFLIADSNGEIYNIEATPNDLDIMYADDYFVHANHFTSSKIKVKEDKNLELMPDTIVRHNRMNKLLKENRGSIDLKKLMEFLRDHVNFPWSICKHADKNRRIPFDLTYSAWVMVPATREMWITHGIPCESQFSKYEI